MLLAVGVASAGAAQPLVVGPGDKPFEGGPLEGLSLGKVVDPEGHHFDGLLASKPNASPVAAQDKLAVAAFIGHRSGAPDGYLTAFLVKKPHFFTCFKQDEPCRETARVTNFVEPCTANAPYRMANGVIRVEWLYGSALYYISMVELSDGRIKSATTSPAWAPLTIGTDEASSSNG